MRKSDNFVGDFSWLANEDRTAKVVDDGNLSKSDCDRLIGTLQPNTWTWSGYLDWPTMDMAPPSAALAV